jgi:hypothetical protein
MGFRSKNIHAEAIAEDDRLEERDRTTKEGWKKMGRAVALECLNNNSIYIYIYSCQ